MKPIVRNGKVAFIMEAGKDLVKDCMDEKVVREILAKGNVTRTETYPGFPLTVDDRFFFEAHFEKKEKRFKEDTPE